jgi:hypothetical protein
MKLNKAPEPRPWLILNVGQKTMRLLLLPLFVGAILLSSCAVTTRSQISRAAAKLGVTEEEISNVSKQALTQHSYLPLAWITEKNAALEIGLGDKGGLVVLYRRTNGKWVEDTTAQKHWGSSGGPSGLPPRPPVDNRY